MTRSAHRARSLEELEPDRRPIAPGGETRMTATVRELRRKRIDGLTVEDLRLLIRQDVGLAHLLPLALEALRLDPLAEGDMYEGDLLDANRSSASRPLPASPATPTPQGHLPSRHLDGP
ncbi:contact-dependent growth inhibition system immunity protein [Streptomyces sp. CO7]